MRPPKKGLKLKGWLYEKAVNDKLIEEFGFTRYFPSQWFQYQEHNKRYKFCQTDGLLFTPKQYKILIVECKYKHTPDAYWQLEDKYVPVVRKLFPDWEISTIEIVKWYDPSTAFPTEVVLKKDILDTRPNEFGVHICNP